MTLLRELREDMHNTLTALLYRIGTKSNQIIKTDIDHIQCCVPTKYSLFSSQKTVYSRIVLLIYLNFYSS